MGFDTHFIQGVEIPLPTLAPHLRSKAFGGGAPIHHTRFSIIFHQERGLALATAHNIDGATLIDSGVIERRNNFRYDPDVPRAVQMSNRRGYADYRVDGVPVIVNPWDRGHLVRRRSVQWGDLETATQADRESFYWTNIAPQHYRLHDTAWGTIEDWMLAAADESERQASVFTGPILMDSDPVHQNHPDEPAIQIPAGFWKIMAIKHRDQLAAAGFVVLQSDYDSDQPAEFSPTLEQVRISFIELLTGLSFGRLKHAEPLHFGQLPETDIILDDLTSAVQLASIQTVTQPDDIML